MTVIVEQFRPINRHTLRGFARVRFASGMVMDEVGIHRAGNGNLWAAPPARPQLDPDGRALRDPRDKIRYAPLISFATPEVRARWSAEVCTAVCQKYPQALSGPLETNRDDC
jgi:hypothetical protein